MTKLLFWIEGPDLHFCLSYFLQKQKNFELFAIFDVPKRQEDFFKNQSLINFQKQWFYHENIKFPHSPNIEYIENFQKKNKIDLWKLAKYERFFSKDNTFYNFTNDEISSILEQECKLFESILDDVKPDYIIMPMTTLHNNHLFYELCKSKNIKILMLSISNLPYRVILSSTPILIDDFSNFQNKILKKSTLDKIQNTIQSYNYPDKIRNFFNEQGLYKNKSMFSALLEFIKSDNSISKTHYTHFGRSKMKVIIFMLKNIIRRKLRKRFIDKNLLRTFPKNEKFLYHPINLTMERQTLLGAPDFSDSIRMIEKIAKSLPLNYKLYVKEHPHQSARGWRSKSDYNFLKNIKNIRVFHPDVPIDNFYKNCSATISITAGPVLLESLSFGKPCITFSENDYYGINSILKIDNTDVLAQTIVDAIKTKVNVDEVSDFLTFFEEESLIFDWHKFMSDQLNVFLFGGNFSNVNINQQKLVEFLNYYEEKLNIIIQAHLKKIV